MAETVCIKEKVRRRIQRLCIIALGVVGVTLGVVVASILLPSNLILQKLGGGFVMMTVAIACYLMGFTHAHEEYRQPRE